MTNKLPDEIKSSALTTSMEIAEIYASLTCDYNPIHLDHEYAAGTQFGRPIIHGTLALNLLVEAIASTGHEALSTGRLDVRFTSPTFVGETISAHGRRDVETPEQYIVWVENERGIKVIDGSLLLNPDIPASNSGNGSLERET